MTWARFRPTYKNLATALLCSVAMVGLFAPLASADAASDCNGKYPGTSQKAKQQQAACAKGWGLKTKCADLPKGANTTKAEIQAACDFGYSAGTIALASGLGSGALADAETDTDEEAVCSAGALGWIFCPLSEFMSTATTKTAELLEGQLVFRPLNSDQGNAIKAIWSIVLGIANTALAIAFLVVIFSQATSVGLSKYGIKKILPRIIAVAILMNLSFYICSIAVDISNILGISIRDIINSGMSAIDSSKTDVNLQTGATYTQGITAIILALLAAVAAAALGLMPLLLPILAAGFLAVVTAFIILAVRQVLIMLLIVVAPLAFLAWVLPNTEEWFTKWRKLFTSMLLMFPIIMAIFYGSLLVSKVILATGEGGSDGDVGFMTNLIAFVVLTVPLFSLPFIMKTAGGVLERFGLLVNNKNKGLVDRSRKLAGNMQKNSRFSNAMAYRRENREVARTVRRGKPTAYNRAMGAAGGSGYQAYTARKATAIEDKEFEQGVSDAATYQRNFGFDRLERIAQGLEQASGQERVAAARQIMDKGNFAQRQALYNTMPTSADSSNDANRLRQSVSDAYFAKQDNKVAGSAWGGQLLEGTSGGQAGLERAIAKNILDKKIDANALVQDADATGLILKVATEAKTNPTKYTFEITDPSTGVKTMKGIGATEIDSLKRAAAESLTNTGTRTKAQAGVFKDKIDPLSSL